MLVLNATHQPHFLPSYAGESAPSRAMTRESILLRQMMDYRVGAREEARLPGNDGG